MFGSEATLACSLSLMPSPLPSPLFGAASSTASEAPSLSSSGMGVLVGVLLSGIFFAGKVRTMFSVERIRREHSAVYKVTGQIFFASVDRFIAALGPESQYDDAAHHVVIDVSTAHFWDISAIEALDKVVDRMRRNGRHTRIVGLNTASADLFDRFALEDRTGLEIGLAPH